MSRAPASPGTAPAAARPAVTIDDVRRAAAAIEGVAVRTPLIEMPALAALVGHSVALKCEQLQPIGAFKVRGAYNAIQRIPAAVRTRGVITYSSGNHGQAVAWAAAKVGVRAVIVMPNTAPQIKVDGVKKLGGEVVFVGPRSVDRKLKAEEICAAEGLAMIPPFDHPDVIAGQGTCGLEILEQWPHVDTILVPVGGGGLLAGICVAVAGTHPETRVVAVEPEGAAKLTAAMRAGAPEQLAEHREPGRRPAHAVGGLHDLPAHQAGHPRGGDGDGRRHHAGHAVPAPRGRAQGRALGRGHHGGAAVGQGPAARGRRSWW